MLSGSRPLLSFTCTELLQGLLDELLKPLLVMSHASRMVSVHRWKRMPTLHLPRKADCPKANRLSSSGMCSANGKCKHGLKVGFPNTKIELSTAVILHKTCVIREAAGATQKAISALKPDVAAQVRMRRCDRLLVGRRLLGEASGCFPWTAAA